MYLKRHFSFLKSVFLYTLTAFGGPQGHYGMLLRKFVHERKDITEDELLEINAITNLLPGASSTQTLVLLGYLKGGISLAFTTLLIWVLPACILMSLFSFLFVYLDKNHLSYDFLKYIQPMAIGFILYAAFKACKLTVKRPLTLLIVLASAVVCFLFFKNPIVVPILIVLGGICSNYGKRRIPNPFDSNTRKPVRWLNLSTFVAIFLVLAALSGFSRIKQRNDGFPSPEYRIWNISENFYRFGSIVFGGGDVLVPLMYEQFVLKPQHRKVKEPAYMTGEQFLSGSGMVRAIPGPTFSVASFHGGMAFRQWGTGWQIVGCVAGAFFIFLPSFLIVLFFYPIWNNLKKYAVLYRSIEGINAVTVGIMFASTIYLTKTLNLDLHHLESLANIIVVLTTYFLLNKTKIPAPLIVLVSLLLGFIF
ncbi:chromate efflux transporter [Polluticaenibacter yanchengensis]|uniref:Chromate efflux transporter n=1 Tax=Polluticaenibacter yanchengensis TaxID=3014562 RepID=A0ABT4UPD9_9BACT|nr:chromate efflux transporter [Chitinophagaceae bacterium LY-5]